MNDEESTRKLFEARLILNEGDIEIIDLNTPKDTSKDSSQEEPDNLYQDQNKSNENQNIQR